MLYRQNVHMYCTEMKKYQDLLSDNIFLFFYYFLPKCGRITIITGEMSLIAVLIMRIFNMKINFNRYSSNSSVRCKVKLCKAKDEYDVLFNLFYKK